MYDFNLWQFIELNYFGWRGVAIIKIFNFPSHSFRILKAIRKCSVDEIHQDNHLILRSKDLPRYEKVYDCTAKSRTDFEITERGILESLYPPRYPSGQRNQSPCFCMKTSIYISNFMVSPEVISSRTRGRTSCLHTNLFNSRLLRHKINALYSGSRIIPT